MSNVRATPRTGTKFVDITYDLAHASGLASTIKVEVSQDGGATYASVASLSGALGASIAPGTGKTVAWNAGQDWTAALFSTVRVRVTADDGQASGGGSAPAGFVLIPAGTFTMGDSLDGMTDAPTHAVTLAAFYLAKTETTKAEWEYAARGGLAGKRFPWGDTITHSQANYYSSATYAYDMSPTRGNHPTYATGFWPYTSPEGSFAANGHGLFDMAGNGLELCWDWYGSYGSAAVTAPLGPTSGTARVRRGGCWSFDATDLRSAGRSKEIPDFRYHGVGFRSARSSVP